MAAFSLFLHMLQAATNHRLMARSTNNHQQRPRCNCWEIGTRTWPQPLSFRPSNAIYPLDLQVRCGHMIAPCGALPTRCYPVSRSAISPPNFSMATIPRLYHQPEKQVGTVILRVCLLSSSYKNPDVSKPANRRYPSILHNPRRHMVFSLRVRHNLSVFLTRSIATLYLSRQSASLVSLPLRPFSFLTLIIFTTGGCCLRC